MEVSAVPATPSPAATPRQGANTGQRSPRSTRSSCAFSRKRGNEFESNGTSKAWLSSPDSQWMVIFDRNAFQSIGKNFPGIDAAYTGGVKLPFPGQLPGQELVALIVAVSFSAGLNVYATVATLGLLAHAGALALRLRCGCSKAGG